MTEPGLLQRSLLALAAGALAAGPALAHHSYAMFDNTKLVVLKGTLLSFSYVNPHSFISVVGSPDEATAPVRWDVEATSPSALAAVGIKSDTLKPGEKLTVALRPLRDGRLGGAMVFVITPDGVAHGANPANLGLDAAKLKP
jgi:hypothetical protein